ncbi:MAG: TonB-dependent receptor [Steroidobacteraceae bacterium]
MITAISLFTGTASAADDPLEEVVVTALAMRSTIDDAVQPVIVLSGDELQNQLSSSIGETLAKQPGITASYFGPNASRPVIRGLSGERVQMLEDSISALDVSSLSEDHAVSIEDTLATQIEIVKGPAALLYGSGAVGGVVNVLTNRIPEKVPERAVSGTLQVRGDTALKERAGVASLDLGGSAVALHFDGYHRETDDVTVPGSAFSSSARADLLANDPDAFIPQHRIYNSASDSKGGAAGASLIGDNGFIGASVSSFATYYGVPLAPGENPADGGSHIDMHQTRVDLKGELKFSDSWLQAVRVRAAHNNYAHAELEADGAIGTQFQQQGSEARVTLDHQFGDLKGSIGVQYRDLDFAALGDERFVPPSVTRNAGVFLFEQYDMQPLTLQTGLRIEQQRITPDAETGLPNYDKSALSASFGGLWKFDNNQSLAANFTHSQRHPSATELYADGVHDATGQFIVGDTNLKQETANTVDLIWRGGDTVHWHVSAYLDHFQDYIYLAPTGEVEEELPVFNYRQADARYIGAEASVHWHLFEVDDSHLDMTLTSDYVRATLRDGSPVPLIPPLRFGAELEYTQSAWRATLSAFRYNAQDRVADNETSTAGYTMVDASLSRDWSLTEHTTLQTFLRGSNLTDVEARRHTSPLKKYAPLPGRSAELGLTLKF